MDKETIRKHTEQFLPNNAIFIVDIEMKKESISIFVDSDEEVSIDDCTTISRKLSEHLELDDYDLNVSSAGFTKPFKVFRQYKKNVGQPVEVFLTDNSRKSGTLLSAEEGKGITLALKNFNRGGKAKSMKKNPEEKELFIDFSEINMTKGIVTF